MTPKEKGITNRDRKRRTKLCSLDQNIRKHFGLDPAATKWNPGLEIWVLASAIVDDKEAFQRWYVVGRSVHALASSQDPFEEAHLQA